MNRLKYFIFCLLISCSAPDNIDKHALQLDTLATKKSIVLQRDTSGSSAPHFNHAMFFSLADTLINKIANERIVLNYSVDTIQKDAGYKKINGINNASYSKFKPSDKTTVIYYTLYPGVKRYFLHLSIIRVIYSDSLELDQDFKTLKKNAYDRNIGGPGLSYTNDML